VRHAHGGAQKASDDEFRRWLETQEAEWRANAALHSSTLKFWDNTLKRLVSQYREHLAAVEEQLSLISAAQSRMELWESVARFHGIDQVSLSTEALNEVKAVAVGFTDGVSASAARGVHAGAIALTLDGDGATAAAASYAARKALGGEADGTAQLFVGLIDPEMSTQFERMLRRVSRRRVTPQFFTARRPIIGRDGQPQQRTVFFVPLLGEELPRRVLAVLESYDTFRLDENDPQVRAAVLSGDRATIKEQIKRALVERSQHLQLLGEHRRMLGSDQTERCRDLDLYRRALVRERAVAFTISKFAKSSSHAMGAIADHHTDADSQLLRAEGWILQTEMERVRRIVEDADGFLQPVTYEEADHRGLVPPTHYPLNQFTAPFQSIVDTYSTPAYKEINPAIFTAASFPFLFGVMYGDVGHASVLTLMSLYVIFRESVNAAVSKCCFCLGSRSKGSSGAPKKPDETMDTIHFARYVLLLMGIFALYMGFIYNDFFSIGLSLYKTRYTIVREAVVSNKSEIVPPAMGKLPVGTNDIYPFGFDPTWHESSNQLMFFNSLKMKLAIVIAVVHMTFGLVLRVMNDVYFSSNAPTALKRTVAWWKLWLEDIPMIVFLLCVFGYMTFLIILKWCIDWNAPGAGAPPSLVDTMIGMVLSPGTIKDPMFSGQAQVQVVLLLIAFICVPLILFGKPCVEKRLHGGGKKKKHSAAATAGLSSGGGSTPIATGSSPVLKGMSGDGHHSLFQAMNTESDTDVSVSHGLRAGVKMDLDEHSVASAPHAEHEFDFGEEMVHQGIETIEFVLATISHTASYLRLWALSLAHSQLSQVFWDKALRATVEMKFPAAIVIGFAIWAFATFGILCAMDVLECYLHALRLHWVEFNTKFFKGDGKKFIPLSFNALMDETGDA
jgi:V-type H+-transporting ATPase subunit a